MAVNLHGVDYVTVKERVKEFHELYPNGAISTKILHNGEKQIIFKTVVVPDMDRPERVFTGMASELKDDEWCVEKGETSSCGRAMAFLNIGIEAGIASADDMDSFNQKSGDQKAPRPNYDDIDENFTPFKKGDNAGKKMSELGVSSLKWIAEESSMNQKVKDLASSMIEQMSVNQDEDIPF